MINLKKLIRIQVLLIMLEVISVLSIFMFGIWFYNNWQVLKKADLYKPNSYKVESLKATTSGGFHISTFAIGKINGREKSCSVDNKITFGDTISVWHIPENRIAILRLSHERAFDKFKYQKVNSLIFFFVFIPTIAIWFFERIITRKIKTLKK